MREKLLELIAGFNTLTSHVTTGENIINEKYAQMEAILEEIQEFQTQDTDYRLA